MVKITKMEHTSRGNDIDCDECDDCDAYTDVEDSDDGIDTTDNTDVVGPSSLQLRGRVQAGNVASER